MPKLRRTPPKTQSIEVNSEVSTPPNPWNVSSGVVTAKKLNASPSLNIPPQSDSRSKFVDNLSGPTLTAPSGSDISPRASKLNEVGNKIQTGMDRYIQITKRKLSPQSAKINSAAKVTKVNPVALSNENRFAALSSDDGSEKLPSVAPTIKPPPIYLRERNTNALVKKLTELIGTNNFHVIPLLKGNIHETKIQIYAEKNYRLVVTNFDSSKRSYYTYQLKSSKGLSVVIKGIESDVDPDEIKEALGEAGFIAKSVFNIKNKEKRPQPLFRIDLEPESKKLKKGTTHPIYDLRYLLHRRITVEEPRPRSGPVQCSNCQEYGHTKSYCTLRSVCVVCGEFHSTSECTSNKSDTSVKKCSNCGGPHTANYRGCPVYSVIKQRMYPRQNPPSHPPTQHTQPQPSENPSSHSQKHVSLTVQPGMSYASVLKPKQPEPTLAPPSQSLELMIFNLTQSMAQFMSNMQNMLRDMVNNQNQLIQALLAKK